jgi:hypothetical protein
MLRSRRRSGVIVRPLNLIVKWQLVAPREVQEQMEALLDSLCAQRALGPLWIVGRSRVTVTHFTFTFVARR